MGKPSARSPLLGYNHNVRYGGRILHVQTEDSGPANPHLFTHLFFEGSILATKRNQYDAEEPEDAVRSLMQRQHKDILKELKQGIFDDRLLEFFAARGEDFISPSQLPIEPPPAPEPDAPVLQVQAYEEPSMPPEMLPPSPLSFPLPTPSPGPEVLDLDAIATPAPDQLAPPEAIPSHLVRPTPTSSPGSYNIRRPTRDIGSGAPGEIERRRFPRPPSPTPASPVVVQRRIVVGAKGNPGVSVAPRPRRPGGGIPYVVQEGSHPNIQGRLSQQGLPPPRSMANSVDSGNAPRTISPPPIPEEAVPESMVSTRSLDDVILAYLSKGDSPKR
jgi:hypothetical protein